MNGWHYGERSRREEGRINLLRMKSAASHKRPESGRCCSDFQGQARIRSGAGSGRFDGDWTNNEPTSAPPGPISDRVITAGRKKGLKGIERGGGVWGNYFSSSSSLAAVLSPNSSLVVRRFASLGEIQSWIFGHERRPGMIINNAERSAQKGAELNYRTRPRHE